MPREIFTDGFNSLAHVGLGVVAPLSVVIPAGYLMYQFIQGGDNLLIDLSEFGIGYLIGLNIDPKLKNGDGPTRPI